MTKTTARQTFETPRTVLGASRLSALGLSIAVAVMDLSLASPYGAFAAGPKPAASLEAGIKPIILAGRWSGTQHGYSLRAPVRDIDNAKPRMLTYDIVACGGDWCGIAVSDETPCGALALRLKRDTAKNRSNAFSGKLELAQGAAPYVVEAWFSPPGETAGEGSGQPHLNFIGDTGTELLMMRRSFPFQAELARTGDAVCTLEKATS